jgi:mRNA-degrading endonuclease HigB of HigAB toxin-antitoxin module
MRRDANGRPTMTVGACLCFGHRKAVFNICGGKYQLVVDSRCDLGRIYLRHVVTHGVYDRLIEKGLL